MKEEPGEIDHLINLPKEELVARLMEAESSLEAIRGGEIDAFIVPGPNADSIYTLKDADHPYRLLIEDMNEGAITLVDATIFYSNQCFARILKYPLEKIIGSSIYDYLQPHERTKFEDFLKDAKQGDTSRSEFNLVVGNSPLIQVQISVNPITFEGFEGHCLIVTDVTELKLKEEVLEKWSRIFENVQWGIAICSTDASKFEMVNPAFLRMYGYTAKELMMKPVSNLFSSLESQYNIDKDARIAREKGRHIFESTHRRKDGTSFPVEVDLTAVKDQSNKKIFYYVMSVRDLTDYKKNEDLKNEILERKNRERILSENEEQLKKLSAQLEQSNRDLQQFASIVESSDDAIISKDLKGVIASWNKGAERIFGYTAEEAIGKPVSMLIPKDRKNEEPAILQRIIQGERIDHYDTIRQRKDGSLVDISLTISPIRDSNGIVGASKIARDITERKQIEKELKRLASVLEERVTERTQLLEDQTGRLRQLAVELTEVEQKERRRLAEVLHDHLQQYLVASKMRLVLIERKSVNADKDGLAEARSYIDKAIDASRQLTAELRPPVLYEGGLSAGLRYLGQKMEDQHKIHVHLSLSEGIEPGSDLIKIMIYQCVQELLFNAVKYAQVTECFVNLVRLENRVIQVTVEDKGLGFDISNLGITDKGGFGLFSIRERVRAMGGELKVSSMPGQGSVFTITVPDKIGALVVEGSGIPEEKLFIRERLQKEGIVVLVADDHPIIRHSIASLLLTQPFIKEVIEAGSGEEAIRKAEAADPDIILMDINMPVMNGIEATQILCNRNPQVKIIGLSVQAEEEMARTMKEAGAIAYFNKGDDTNSLIETIKKHAYEQFSPI